jgi:hypothetical protein
MAPALLIVGASIFGLLGIAHGWYTFRDSQNPRRLVPDSRAVLEAMKATDVRLSRGGTTMWKAWLGFNYSHTLGVLMFAVGCIAFALSLHALAPHKVTLLIPVAVGATYFWLAVRYWFWAPALGIAIGTLCLSAAWLTY